MLLPLPDAFARFAEQCDLCLSADCVGSAPRDVLLPLEEAEQHFIVTLARRDAPTPTLRLVFVTPLVEPDPPSVRDVLWWLAGDAWAVEKTAAGVDGWAALYGYPAAHEATGRVFKQHAERASALAALLGEVGYRRLLALYDASLSAPRVSR